MKQFVSTFHYLLRPLLFIGAGGCISYALLSLLLSDFLSIYAWIGIPMLLITLFLMVMGIVNIWVNWHSWKDNGVFDTYSWRQLFWLYFKCFVVLFLGTTLALVFYLMLDVLPDYLQLLVRNWSIFYYIICFFLTISAFLSILRGEALQEIRLRNTQSENAMLKSQLNPHFLYNMLNTIDALIWLDSTKASEAVNQLSGVMRYLTYSARQSEVSLKEEIDNLRELVALQQLRMSNSKSITLDISVSEDVDLLKMKIAPLLFLPLVENTFKHCLATDVNDAIRISLDVTLKNVTLQTDNLISIDFNSSGLKEEKSSLMRRNKGVGLDTLKRRLALLYPSRNQFFSGVENGRWRSFLDIRF